MASCPNNFQAFEEVVRSVVFAGGRPGSGRVELGQFVIRTIKDGAPLNSQTWTSAVKEGAHLTQAMVLLGTKNDLRKCFVSGCSGHLQSDGNRWLVKQIPLSLRIGHLPTCYNAYMAIVMYADEVYPLK